MSSGGNLATGATRTTGPVVSVGADDPKLMRMNGELVGGCDPFYTIQP